MFATLDSSGYVRLSFRKSLNDNNKVVKKSVAVSTDTEIPIVVNNKNNCNNNNIYYNYCETLKLDRSGEKENPFAGNFGKNFIKYDRFLWVTGQEVLAGRKDGSSVESDYHKISKDSYSYFRRNHFFKSFSYNGPNGRKLIFKN